MNNPLIYTLQQQLSKSSKKPLYEQFVEIVKKQITSGALHQGDFLPSEREFTEQLTVSRITIRKALAQLEAENIVTRQQGYGTIINDPLEYSLKAVKGFSQQIELRGQTPNTIWVNKSIIQATKEVAKQLRIEEGDNVFILKRIRYVDDSPVSIEESYVPTSLIANSDDIQISLYRYFHSQNIIPQHAKSWVSAILPNEEFKEIIQISDKVPVLVIKQLVFDKDNQPIEYSINHCRSDMYVFTSEE